jgi:transposase
VDETHAKVKDARRKYGWGLMGLPVYVRHYKSNGQAEGCSAICSMTVQGIMTADTYDAGVNADVFLDTLEHRILPFMNPFPGRGSVLVMDNATVHDKDVIIALCIAHNVRVIFLPQYSYDLNPIELAFACSKRRLLEVYHVADLNKPLRGQLEECLLNACTAEQACAMFRHCHIEVTAATEAWAKGL